MDEELKAAWDRRPRCPYCDQEVPLRPDGSCDVHRDGGAYCLGIAKWPLEQAYAPVHEISAGQWESNRRRH